MRLLFEMHINTHASSLLQVKGDAVCCAASRINREPLWYTRLGCVEIGDVFCFPKAWENIFGAYC